MYQRLQDFRQFQRREGGWFLESENKIGKDPGGRGRGGWEGVSSDLLFIEDLKTRYHLSEYLVTSPC